MIKEITETTLCYHCGEHCQDESITSYDKHFCCQGCKTVYEILNKVELCDYYSISQNPGINQKTNLRPDKFAFLDDETVKQKLIHFKDSTQTHITFYLPQMHCSSCIWLLEHLAKLNENIVRSQVNFLKKELSVIYVHNHISLRKIVELLASIGYEPHFSLHDLGPKKVKTYDKVRIYKIGITGFCFGNIMLLSFPEYFSLGNIEEKELKFLFSYLILALSLPVFFYSASEFFVSAWKSMKQKFLNIDAPIAVAILITFCRSVYEIMFAGGAGYLDSMTGIVFFMLIGRFFQNKTYNTLSFNRDYTSYFPLGVTVFNENNQETQIPLSQLKVGQRIRVHNQEIIPADCILFLGSASIDYSFVSGEALPVKKNIGEIIYAGGKQLGGALELEVVKDVSQSYLTQLWNNEAFQVKEKDTSYIHTVSKYFTLVLFSIAAIAAGYWYVHNPSMAWNAVTSILIVACPCALLLSATFTNGNMLRVLQKFGFYARSAQVIESIAKANSIVFDKTGTITQQHQTSIVYKGEKMSLDEIQIVRSLVSQSNHPLSRAILQSLAVVHTRPVKKYDEKVGFGIQGDIDGKHVEIGSRTYVNAELTAIDDGIRVYMKIDGTIIGYFLIQIKYREGLASLFNSLNINYQLSLISGDNASEESKLKHFFNGKLLFNQAPQDKLNYVKDLQNNGKIVVMVGDGLNDAGALKQSNVGIAVSDNINNFSPACDVILIGKNFHALNLLLNYCKHNKTIINSSFVISIFYNIFGLYFAVQAQLQPVVAAILMPISSVSIVLFTTALSSVYAFTLKKQCIILDDNKKLI